MKWILIQRETYVNNIIVPGPPELKTILESENIEVIEADNNVFVEPGWSYDKESGIYSAPVVEAPPEEPPP